MKAKTNENKNKHSARKKLIPAVAMLTTSAIMLSTATYAWFTMNKEVEVTGIKLSATVPASMQISLGHVDGTGDSATLKSPKNTNDSEDWSGIVAFDSVYKSFGLLEPASSIDGNKLYYTNDATGVGRTVANGAKFFEATDKATLSVKTNDTTTNGHYVDIPVYFRTSETGTDEVELSVKADITVGQTTNNSLYKAARVAILSSEAEADMENWNDINSTVTTDSIGVIAHGSTAYYADKVDDNTSKNAVAKAGTYTGGTDTDQIYEAAKIVTQFDNTSSTKVKGDTVVKVKKHASNDTDKVYGDTTKKIIRVWLEGEDTACWNAYAGQDFTITLNFIDKSTISGS